MQHSVVHAVQLLLGILKLDGAIGGPNPRDISAKKLFLGSMGPLGSVV